MNYQSANQDDIFFIYKPKTTFKPLSLKKKKEKKDSNFVVTVLLSIVLDAWLWLHFSSLTLFRST